MAARIEPEWVEPLAGHLVKRTYSRAALGAQRAGAVDGHRAGHAVRAADRGRGRQVSYGRIDPVLSRELFIRHALVEGDWKTHHTFFHENRALLDEVEELENRARRRDILVDDETLFALLRPSVSAPTWCPARHFDSWWKRAGSTGPTCSTSSGRC